MARLHARGLAALTSAAVIATGLSVTTTLAPAVAAEGQGAANSGSGLDKRDRQLLAEANADGERTVTLLVAAQKGRSDAVADRLAALGGKVAKREDDLSYLRVEVPTSAAKKAAAVAGISAVDLDEVIPLDDPKPAGQGPVTPQSAPGAATPQDNPYMPIRDTGAARWLKQHPTWDGRGTTIGVVDSGVDLDHPALQTTTTGQRKVTDWVTATDPFTDEDPTWVPMTDRVSGASFAYKGVTYTAPSAATYRVGLFDERDPRLGGEVGSDVNRDGNPAGSSGVFAVLWNTELNEVYVDTDQDKSFADEKAMTDFKKKYDVGRFGADNPGTAVKETMPFVVQTDKQQQVVNIGIVSGAHGSHVAGITAANKMFGGAMTGAAPGAQVKSVRVCLFVAGCTAHALLEGMTYIAKEGKVDVINMSIGGLPALNDGNNARAVLYNRIIEQYRVQMFISAGNSGPGMNTIGDPSVASDVMSVGSAVTRETWQSNYGSDSAYADNLHYYSSRGPREDGGFKPSITAPGSAVSTVPTWQSPAGACIAYQCEVGYAMFNGTSMASPQAAGAAALLVSAGKQAGVQTHPDQLRQAINSSARFFKRYGAYEQGNGQMDVAKAWSLLAQQVRPVEISSSVPVSTALSDFLATPGVGEGINDREGVTKGKTYTRTYTFNRTTGPAGIRTYALSWVGNDGTFASAGSVALPRNKAVQVPVTITPSKVGAHSAILNLDDAATPGVDHQTLNTVVVPDEFTAAGNYTVTKTGTIGRNQSESFFVRVPAGTPAFKVDFSGPNGTPGTGQARFLRWHPYGVGIDSNASTACYTPARAAGCDPNSRTTTDPQAGVWEVSVDAGRLSDTAEAPYTLKMSILGAKVAADPTVIPSATAGTPVEKTWTLTNLFGEFTGRAVGSTLGSAKVATPSISTGQVSTQTVVVPAGSTSFRATIGKTVDPAADLDLFVLRDGKVVGQAADGDSEESVTLANPPAGTYTVQVDGYSVPSGSTAYDYTDVFVNPAFGTVAVTDADAVRAPGASWTVPGTVTALTAPAAGRVLLGTVSVRTGTLTIGSADVIVEQVR